MRLPITLHKNYTLNGSCIQQSLTTELLIRNQQNRFWYAWEKWINFEAVVGIFKEEFKINQTVHGILLDFEKKGDTTITSNDKNKRQRLIAFMETFCSFSIRETLWDGGKCNAEAEPWPEKSACYLQY